MPDHKLDLSRAPRIADMINAWFCPQCGLRDETARGIDQDGTCSSCGSDCCTWDSVRGHLAHYGWEVVSADDARELYRIRAEATETPTLPRAELTGEERAVLEAVASIPAQELRSSGNWYGWAKPIGEAELARRAAARKEGKP